MRKKKIFGRYILKGKYDKALALIVTDNET
jgi:tRNA(Glu) U13 pseudouridine synthase TruD